MTSDSKRIAELTTVEENIVQLLHFAGCTLASLHPDPLTAFTPKVTSFAQEDDEDDEQANTIPQTEPLDRADQFKKYAEAYYTTLNEIQLSLRNSIRHLRVSRASTAPLIDPRYAAVANPAGGIIAAGGVAFNKYLATLPPLEHTLSSSNSTANGSQSENTSAQMSNAALKLEKEALEDLTTALSSRTGSQ